MVKLKMTEIVEEGIDHKVDYPQSILWAIDVTTATQTIITKCLIARFVAMTLKLLNLSKTINIAFRIRRISLRSIVIEKMTGRSRKKISNQEVADPQEAVSKKATLKKVTGISLRLMMLIFGPISAVNYQVLDLSLSLTDSQRFRKIERMTTILKLEKLHLCTLLLLEGSNLIDKIQVIWKIDHHKE